MSSFSEKVCIVGLGKLGACMAAVFAAAGHQITAVDINPDTVARVQAGIAPVDEPGLQDLFDKNGARIRATASIEEAVLATRIAFVIVPTPSKKGGVFDDAMVLDAVVDIGKAIRAAGMTQYTVVISSTVMPGTCAGVIQPALDDAAGVHIPVVYSPEFIALGSVIDDMRHPDLVLVGADDAAAGEAFIAVLREAIADARNVPWVRMSLVNAELAKISVNAYVTMKISFANQLASICEGVWGADANVVLAAIGRDRRIGPAYLKAGGPYAGPCFPRDNRAFQALATSALCDAPLSAAADAVNGEVLERVVAMVPREDTDVAILGMTYKPNTPVTEESLGIHLKECFPLAETHDPTVNGRSQDVVDRHNHIVVATAWPEYAKLDYSTTEVVIDVWGIIPDAPNVIRPGVGP